MKSKRINSFCNRTAIQLNINVSQIVIHNTEFILIQTQTDRTTELNRQFIIVNSQ